LSLSPPSMGTPHGNTVAARLYEQRRWQSPRSCTQRQLAPPWLLHAHGTKATQGCVERSTHLACLEPKYRHLPARPRQVCPAWGARQISPGLIQINKQPGGPPLPCMLCLAPQGNGRRWLMMGTRENALTCLQHHPIEVSNACWNQLEGMPGHLDAPQLVPPPASPLGLLSRSSSQLAAIAAQSQSSHSVRTGCQ
jgi:hypothetical protein